MKRSDNDQRPDPDQLLALCHKEEECSRRGKLRVFLGMAPGVGKTYTMLEQAKLRRKEGLDVVAGVVETHGRLETQALLEGLEVLPRHEVAYKDFTLTEFDLDGALKRAPSLLLVDELAHTNVPGSRHAKRWQDVLELLDHGVDVYTAMNIQHLDSLNDVVAQITGVKVRETVPDSVLEQAESVVLVDLTPEDLHRRMQEGKVYIPHQAEWAAQNFFRAGNLIALRELAMRTAAQQVNIQVLTYRQGRAIQTTWPTSERIMVCVGPAPSSAKLVRAAKRLAAGLQAPWLALYIQTPASLASPQEQQDRAILHLRMAEELGAQTFVITGTHVAKEIVAFARQQNVTKIIIGKPARRKWRDYVLGSPVDEIIRLSEEIDIHVIRGEEGQTWHQQVVKHPRKVRWTPYLLALGGLAACTGACFAMYPYFELANLIMVYLLGVIVVALSLGRLPAILTSALSVLAFDYFFVPPRFDFAVSDTHYLVTFAVMFVVAVLMSSMAARIKFQAEAARHLTRQTQALATLSRGLAASRGLVKLLAEASRHLADVFECHAYFLMPDSAGKLQVWAKPPGTAKLSDKDLSVAQWVFTNAKPAGLFTQTLPESQLMFLPLAGVGEVVGVVGLKPSHAQAADSLSMPEQQRLLDACVSQTALAIEVDRLEEDAQKTRVEMETERLRASLLSGLTHDFQTPLSAIAGSAESILFLDEPLMAKPVKAMAENIRHEAVRLSRLVDNLLRIANLESGDFKPNRQPTDLVEVVGTALNRLEKTLAGHPVKVNLPEQLPLVPMDGVLMEQLFINLLENAAKHTPPGTVVTIAGGLKGQSLQVSVSDLGPGVPPEELSRVFDRFYRVSRPDQADGYGLGLAICKSIAKVHGGQLTAENLPGGGLSFTLTLPLTPADNAGA